MTYAPPLATIILAAGKGTRMKSDRAKVLHEVFYQPMLLHVLDAVQPLQPERSLVIVGHQQEEVQRCLAGRNVTCVRQEEQLGTGHAVQCAKSALGDFSGDVMILCGDSPLLLSHHLIEMRRQHQAAGARLTIMTTLLDNPANYGRIITDAAGRITAVVEQKDATEQQRAIKIINAGIYCVDRDFLFTALRQLTSDNSQGELYLTDIVSIAVQSGLAVESYEHPFPMHVLGVNSRIELSQAHAELQARRNHELMQAGITMHNPPTTAVAPTARLGPDCILMPQVTVTGASEIGSGCIIESGAVIMDASLGDAVHVGANSVLHGCAIAAGRRIAPLSRIIGKTGV